jgi:hypothetical protein
MFMCCVKQTSVINLIYSGQQLFTHNVFLFKTTPIHFKYLFAQLGTTKGHKSYKLGFDI